jgi:2-polyprenyl-6-methoxyphenol hydroxylase-like FAD-dependent oxidoreductase
MRTPVRIVQVHQNLWKGPISGLWKGTQKAAKQLLDSYEVERYPVAKTVLRGSDRGFTLETASHPVARWVRANIAVRLVGR